MRGRNFCCRRQKGGSHRQQQQLISTQPFEIGKGGKTHVQTLQIPGANIILRNSYLKNHIRKVIRLPVAAAYMLIHSLILYIMFVVSTKATPRTAYSAPNPPTLTHALYDCTFQRLQVPHMYTLEMRSHSKYTHRRAAMLTSWQLEGRFTENRSFLMSRITSSFINNALWIAWRFIILWRLTKGVSKTESNLIV